MIRYVQAARSWALGMVVVSLGCGSGRTIGADETSSTGDLGTTTGASASDATSSPVDPESTSTSIAGTTESASADSTGGDSTTTIDGSDTTGSTGEGDPPAYGPCGMCGRDETELDLGGTCICSPVCRVSEDCPDPATGANPVCAEQLGSCLLLCEDATQCPNGAQCPDPRTLPEGAQGYCHFR